MYFEKRLKILKKAIEDGGISLNEASEIYDSYSSAYKMLEELTKRNILSKTEAPYKEQTKYIYCITEKGKELLPKCPT